ncbi:MAG TPA: lysophospholipid acyltransferase family protein [Micromonosporaceae bacterium]|nr:lysophospholipid acyltransferase family protein [Micromonosporaceae bacterium]
MDTLVESTAVPVTGPAARNGARPVADQPIADQPVTDRQITDREAAPGQAAGQETGGRQPDVWDERVASALAFLRRRLTGDFEVDEFGFDPELTEATIYPLLRALYRKYFRVETTGVENLPVDGPALIVANHSGTLPVDALMLTVAVHDETPNHRYLRLLGADLVFRIPIVSEFSRKFGTTLACNADAERLLRQGEYVGVFPEGFKGVGKPYRERYRLQRFGRGGFVAAALRTGTPIVPAAIVGAEEIYPLIGNIKPLAKALGVPYIPITPLFPWFGPLGVIPLPSKWLIAFCKPIDTANYDGDPEDPLVVFNLADEVRETIQQTLHELLQRRPDPFG